MKKDFYKNLHRKLSKLTSWPTVYMFKFIVPADMDRIKQVESLFDETVEVQRKYSSSGKYVSLTGKEVMLDPDEVIKRYEEAARIEGIISL